MLVRFKSDVTPEMAREARIDPRDLGERFVVHALIFREKMWAIITVRDEAALPVPVSLLEVEDGTLSRHWSAHITLEGEVVLGPPPLHDLVFLDRCDDGDWSAINERDKWFDLMTREALKLWPDK